MLTALHRKAPRAALLLPFSHPLPQGPLGILGTLLWGCGRGLQEDLAEGSVLVSEYK